MTKTTKKTLTPSKVDSKNVDIKSTTSAGTLASKTGAKSTKKSLCYIKPTTDSVYKKAREIISSHNRKEAFHVMNLSAVKERVELWKSHMPNVAIHYAIKANDDEHLLRFVLESGCNFDAASKAEIERVMGLGARPDQIIFANPCKSEAHIAYAKQVGVKVMTFDSAEEAEKIAAIYPKAELVLRIAVEDTDAPCPMTKKFGAPLELWDEILDSCIRLDINLVGVSFHVGSGGCSPDVYRTSLEGAHSIFEKATSLGMPPLTLLDIGGGFSQPWSCNKDWTVTNTKNSFEVVAPQVRQYIRNIFPETNGAKATVKVIGEPGRFICQGAVSLCTRIFLKKKQRDCTHYFVDSGVYQALPSHNYDGEFFRAEPMIEDRKEFAKRIKQSENSFVWGQTCDGIDWLMKDQVFPAMEHGEWLMYRGMGAYNQVVQCQFNGYDTPTVFYM